MIGNSVSSPRSSTDRVRRHRRRRAGGVRFVACMQVEVTPELVAGLVQRGYLVPASSGNGASRVTRDQIIAALEEALEDFSASSGKGLRAPNNMHLHRESS
jgi:hypothetical protein